jgi:hypothetical protein
MNKILWIVQVLLAAVFLFAGGVKLVLPAADMAGPVAVPVVLLRFVAVCEVLGAVGLIVPWLTRIRPGLTPLAACGLVIIMIGAVVISLMGGMAIAALISVVVGVLAAFVAYGRGQSTNFEKSRR